MVNRIGILGGMGPKATMHFLQVLFQSLSEISDPGVNCENPDMTILMENTIPSIGDAIDCGAPETAQRINRSIASLILSGCDPVAIPCITAHALVEKRWFEAGVTDFRQCIISQFQPIFADRIAVLATDGAILSDVFEPLSGHFDLVYPRESLQKKITALVQGPHGLRSLDPDPVSCKKSLNEIIHDLRKQGIEDYLAGCTEIEVFVANHGLDDRFVLPMEMMCEQIVEQVQSGVLKS